MRVRKIEENRMNKWDVNMNNVVDTVLGGAMLIIIGCVTTVIVYGTFWIVTH